MWPIIICLDIKISSIHFTSHHSHQILKESVSSSHCSTALQCMYFPRIWGIPCCIKDRAQHSNQFYYLVSTAIASSTQISATNIKNATKEIRIFFKISLKLLSSNQFNKMILMLMSFIVYCAFLAAPIPKSHGMSLASNELILNILHVNDIHSRFEQTNKYGGKCKQKHLGILKS